jgi:hypothetical protein
VSEQPSVAPFASWRPQRFGRVRATKVVDPLIEPLWIGERVLAHVDRTPAAPSVAIVDGAGRTIDPAGPGDELSRLHAGIERAVRADGAVIDGYLTRQATQPSVGQFLEVSTARTSTAVRRLFLGESAGRRAQAVREESREAAERLAADGAPLAFVAIDLLSLDGAPLLDVPLLERKRLLDSTVEPDELVRVGPYVRLPAERWYGTWRSAGFVEIALKAANGRYRPGEESDSWATLAIPRR